MPCDKGVLKKRKKPKGSLKCAFDQRGPSNVPKEKNCPEKKWAPKTFNKFSQVCPNQKWANCFSKEVTLMLPPLIFLKKHVRKQSPKLSLPKKKSKKKFQECAQTRN
jgi:hypothetical protein